MPNKKNEPIQSVKGMQDIMPEEFAFRRKILEKAKNIAEYYGFEPIHTPYLEKIDLFTATLGESTDIVEKQMYALHTRGGDKLVLRPEGTAPAVRAYLEHGMHTRPQPVMLYYDGFFFRHESPQKGRRRELQQFGMEILGESDSITDAIVIKTTLAILEEIGLKSLKVHINSIGDSECRKVYHKELTAYYRKKINNLCADCKRRLKINPLRLLDCKEEGCREIKKDAPQMLKYLCERCSTHFKNLLEILDASNVTYYIDHYLVRGLDYYSRTVFEIFLDEETKGVPDGQKIGGNEFKSLALAGGGRYDSLAKLLGGKDVPAIGCAIGIDRVTEIMKERHSLASHEKQADVFFIQIGQLAKQKSLFVTETLRKAKISMSHSLSKDGLKNQLALAAKLRNQYALIFGQKEALDNTIIARDMRLGSQETVPLAKITEYLKKNLA